MKCLSVVSQKRCKFANCFQKFLPTIIAAYATGCHAGDRIDQSFEAFLGGSRIIKLDASRLCNQFNSEVVKEFNHLTKQVGFGSVFGSISLKVGLPRVQKREQFEFSPALVAFIGKKVSDKGTRDRSANTPEKENNKHFLNGVPVHLRLLLLAVLGLIGGVLGGIVGALAYLIYAGEIDLPVLRAIRRSRITILKRQQHQSQVWFGIEGQHDERSLPSASQRRS